jgi:hypothetical protein
MMIIVAAMLVLPTAVSAQGQRQGGGRGMMAGNPIAIVLEHAADLKLTESQTHQLHALNEGLVEKNRPIMEEMAKAREAGNVDRETMMAKMATVRENNEAAQAKLEDILDADQLAQAMKFIEDARPQRGRRGGIRR